MQKQKPQSNDAAVKVVTEHHAAMQQKAATARKGSPQSALYTEFASLLASIIARLNGQAPA